MDKPLFSVVKWPDSQYFMNHKTEIHLIESEYGIEAYGKNAYFVPNDKIQSYSVMPDHWLYVPVSFPESQLYMGKYSEIIHLINDSHGRERYGNAAYLIPLPIYKKVKKEFLLEYS